MTLETKGKKVVIIGGVAGGASAAARLRRLDETSNIIILERGEYVSFANCGLPYHIGGEIEEREKLLLHSPSSLKSRFNVDVRIKSEVKGINRDRKTVSVLALSDGTTHEETYDLLILSTGATPLRPNIPGIDLPTILTLRDIPDMDRIIARLASRPKNLLVIGGGFIGLEMIEQLHRKFSEGDRTFRLIEAYPHILPPLDPEMVTPIEHDIAKKGVFLELGDPLVAFEQARPGVVAITKSGKRFDSDFALLSIGVRPEVSLATQAGLSIGTRGGISVDDQLRTSDPSIFAIGDCIETRNLVTGEYGVTPLAGPANRQGRIVADVISGLESHYKGTLGTAIVRAFDLTAAVTGANEKTLQRSGIPYEAIFLHPSSRASYHPGASPLKLKVLFSPNTGKVLGAQAVGRDGVDKRIDVLATALYAGLTVDDLTDLELSYAPPFGSAKDPVNLAGMIGQNIERKLVDVLHPKQLEAELAHSSLLDVREDHEREKGSINPSLHIPLGQLRERMSELPRDKPIIVYCQSGLRSYNACRILRQNGFECKNLSGAYLTWSALSKS